jgi:hypothetical protein
VGVRGSSPLSSTGKLQFSGDKSEDLRPLNKLRQHFGMTIGG